MVIHVQCLVLNQHLIGCLTLFLHRKAIIEHHCSCRTPPPTTGALSWANRLTKRAACRGLSSNLPARNTRTYEHTGRFTPFSSWKTHKFYKTSDANTFCIRTSMNHQYLVIYIATFNSTLLSNIRSPVQRSSPVWTGVRVEFPRTPATTVWHIPKTASPSLLFSAFPGIAGRSKIPSFCFRQADFKMQCYWDK